MQTEQRTYKLTGLTELLGSRPSNKVYSDYIAAKTGIDQATLEEEEEYIVDDEKGVTVFPEDPETEAKMLLDYQIKGFLKEALETLKSELSIAAARSKADKYLFVMPRKIPVIRDGKPIDEIDELCERPLRAKTMQGDRIALACSEQINTPWEITITIKLLKNTGTAKSKPITWEAIESALSYGELRGLGQWRNASYGQFTWEEIK